VKFSTQVVTALKGLHPGVRKDIRRALDDLSAGIKRDTAALQDELTGFHRLRVGKYRVIYRRDPSGELIAEYLAPRSDVYGEFEPPAKG